MNPRAGLRPRARTWRVMLNVAAFQGAWLACVALAADGAEGAGIAAVAAAVLLHFALSEQPDVDAKLVAIAIGVGAVWDTLAVRAGWIAFAAPGPVPGLAPAWILALWALFATTLCEPLRWLHARPWLAALLGAIGGPLSYAAAARLGACRFADPVASTLVLGLGWAVMMPLLVTLARRLEAGRREALA